MTALAVAAGRDFLLSYQHGYHAGNFADVHKHATQCLILEVLNRKAKPWSYFETHAGTARYDLTGELASKTGEYREGIGQLWQRCDEPLLAPYLEAVAAVNEDSRLSAYPGSPWLASQAMREGDKMAIMELHPGEVEVLKGVFRRDKGVAVHHRDGYEGVASLMPPKPNRGLVLIDPPYEVKTEYLQVARFIEKVHKLWSNGCFMIWYPLLQAANHLAMLDALKASGIRKQLRAEFMVKSSSHARMYGSGLLIINPPWQLDEQLESLQQRLYEQLAEQEAAKPQVQWWVEE